MQPAGRTTRVTRRIRVPPTAVYRALMDPDALVQWLPPEGMTGTMHTFEPEEGGRLRMSLTYQDPTRGPGGKTTDDTDTFDGRIVRLVPDERVVWVVRFESDEEAMSAEMRVTWKMADAPSGADVSVVCEDVPTGIRLKDNEAGSASSLQKLASYLEAQGRCT